ncbi:MULTISPECIES: hypothetical protein [Mycobacteriaceae]|uniref:Uncharacterized protein n=2 Tax=Mycobacteroides TaxID=670516 RepID=A0A4R8QUG5_9MYCO|nr:MULTISPECIES: hypothetical protein [Mycobacteriaceae]AMT73500.1 hypothetical protein ABG82_02770 [Mycobacteroides immunogenum]ANO06666.1 hypothetical protein BAB75_02775 [Mycobacteroides immunogenum]KIU38750.1 hypothetical protein TL11_20800 [Mycobacteroides immunogenum]KPG08689.1 hypothetical protein AN909_14845 [Mycobacteroides immunogenum]KPG08935.1 hypothetical protein AN910_18150 [Mycobacteroides immunogenum]
MALTGDRARARGGRVVAVRWVLLLTPLMTLLLALAVALVPVLRCPPALDVEAPHAVGASLAHVGATASPQVVRVQAGAEHIAAAQLTAVQVVDVHSGCSLPAAVLATMAAAGPGHGWWALAVAAALLAAAAAAWVPASRGPPGRGRLGFLCSGRERLQHLCVMRR